MRADVIVDLQFGSTGKGAVAAWLTQRRHYDVSVRAQSIQAGHTIYYEGKPYKMRTIPCAWVDPNVSLVLAPGCFIEKALLLDEIKMINDATGKDVRDRLFLDYRANYITTNDEMSEINRKLDQKMGSTAHGAGSSLIRKLWRDQTPTRVCDDDWATEHGLQSCDTIHTFKDAYGLVEGCQGTMLSIHTSPYYPYVTSRECTALGVLSEVGIAPADIREVHGVFRTLPIRVGGNSGDTGADEITWGEVSRRCGRQLEPEITTVTKRQRRIFEFSFKDMEQAILLNKPDYYYMTFTDYLAPGIYGAKSWDDVPEQSKAKAFEFLQELYSELRVQVSWMGTGEQADMFIEGSPEVDSGRGV